MVQVLVVSVDVEVVTHEAMTPQCGRSVVQVLVVRVDIAVATYEAQCGRTISGDLCITLWWRHRLQLLPLQSIMGLFLSCVKQKNIFWHFL